MTRQRYDAVVVGSGPNGLSAAVALARAGHSVLVREAHARVGGGTRTEELTLPGFRHDTFSAAHPLAAASPFLRTLPLEKFGLKWIRSPSVLAHPLPDGSAALMEQDLFATASSLGADGPAWVKLMEPFVKRWQDLFEDVLAPPLRWPKHPVLMARFGMDAVRGASALARSRFRTEAARALFGGIAAHAGIPLESAGTAALGLVLGLAGHAVGWPIPEGGAGAIGEALASYLRSLGGEIETGAEVRSLDELPPSRWVFLDLTPRQIVAIAGSRLPDAYRDRLSRYRYGSGAFKLDWALSGPIPWKAPECARAATVHVGGNLEQLELSERAADQGRAPGNPYVLLCQPSLFDPTRAPAGKHTAWGYIHVPNGWAGDATASIEEQIERFAPGFRERILARSVLKPLDLQARNANLIGGDISGGSVALSQILARPAASGSPYLTPLPGVFVCSSSTPPGPGVHGMCGSLAAQAAMESRRA